MSQADQIEMMRLMLEKLKGLEKLGTARPVDLERAREQARIRNLVDLTEMFGEYLGLKEDKVGLEAGASEIADE